MLLHSVRYKWRWSAIRHLFVDISVQNCLYAVLYHIGASCDGLNVVANVPCVVLYRQTIGVTFCPEARENCTQVFGIDGLMYTGATSLH